jgi:hypothetical protein
MSSSATPCLRAERCNSTRLDCNTKIGESARARHHADPPTRLTTAARLTATQPVQAESLTARRTRPAPPASPESLTRKTPHPHTHTVPLKVQLVFGAKSGARLVEQFTCSVPASRRPPFCRL